MQETAKAMAKGGDSCHFSGSSQRCLFCGASLTPRSVAADRESHAIYKTCIRLLRLRRHRRDLHRDRRAELPVEGCPCDHEEMEQLVRVDHAGPGIRPLREIEDRTQGVADSTQRERNDVSHTATAPDEKTRDQLHRMCSGKHKHATIEVQLTNKAFWAKRSPDGPVVGDRCVCWSKYDNIEDAFAEVVRRTHF